MLFSPAPAILYSDAKLMEQTMPTAIRLLMTLLLGMLFMDYNGLRPDFFQHLIDQHENYAYMGAALLIA